MNSSVLFTEIQIKEKVKELASQISQSLKKEEEVLAIGILRGAFYFYTDLLKELNLNVICDFCSVSFYGNKMKASQEATLSLDVRLPIKGKTVLLIDCIADFGHSLNFVRKHIENRQPKRIQTAVLLTKPYARKNSQIDFSGFEVSQDDFIIGYGIDYKNEGRTLKDFRVLNIN